MHKVHQRSFHQHTVPYFILFLLLATGFFAFAQNQGQPDRQFHIGIVTALAYAIWGIYQHLYQGDLNRKIVIEYAAIAIFGVALLWTLLAFIY